MKYEEIKKMVDNVIENEFNHITNYKENKDFKSDIEIRSIDKKLKQTLNKVEELLPGNFELIMDIESEFMNYCTVACGYYFRQGVIAGTTNLKFLEETHIMNSI